MFWTQINVWWTYSQFSWQLCGMASANTELGVNLTASLMRHMRKLKIRVAKYLTSSSQEHTQDLNIILWFPFQGWFYQRNEPLYHSMDYMWTALGERTKANLKYNGYALNIFRRRLNSLQKQWVPIYFSLLLCCFSEDYETVLPSIWPSNTSENPWRGLPSSHKNRGKAFTRRHSVCLPFFRVRVLLKWKMLNKWETIFIIL